MPAVVVMQSMALGWVGDDMEGKLVFRLPSPTNPKKEKPTTSAMAFCIYISHK